MRVQLRLLAPFSILATALYLAFWALQHPASNPLPVSVAGNQLRSATPSKSTHISIKSIDHTNSKQLADTVEEIRP